MIIIRHKWYVMIECFKVGLYWQGLTHDLSKIFSEELMISIRYFDGKVSPTIIERSTNGYSKIAMHHRGRNKHHFHYWIDFDDGKIIPVRMPYKYVLEMVCDFIGACKAYGNMRNTSSPLNYWNNKIDKTFIHKETSREVGSLLTRYSESGKLN